MLCTCDRIVVSFAALVNQWLVWRPECVFESVGREWVGGGVLVALLIPLSVLIKRSFSSSSSSVCFLTTGNSGTVGKGRRKSFVRRHLRICCGLFPGLFSGVV